MATPGLPNWAVFASHLKEQFAQSILPASLQMIYLAFYCALLAWSKFDCFSLSKLIGKF
jgi:hypothetical protein